MPKWLEIIVRTIRSTLRTHQALAIENLALEKDSPDGRVVQPIEKGRVVELK